MLLRIAMNNNQSELARKSGVSQRHISDIVNGLSECTDPVADSLALPFGLTGWHLRIPNLEQDLVGSPAIAKLVEAYINTDKAGRELLDAVANHATRVKVPKTK